MDFYNAALTLLINSKKSAFSNLFFEHTTHLPAKDPHCNWECRPSNRMSSKCTNLGELCLK
jgi:hypothetical protein